ncbi:MAG: hypothetical protein E6Q97_01320 [Desulfurellales bacterium]|nr:MAG: hypothetical protein E6Q97_01320 [Desulfurellales bacterium]
MATVDALTPGHGWLDVRAVAAGNWGDVPTVAVRGELGARLLPWLSAYTYGEASMPGYSAGVGLRGVW